MLSRVADAIYWASRYVERAENVARFIDVSLNLMLEPAGEGRRDWESLVQTTGDQAWFREKYGKATPESVARFVTCDADYPGPRVTSCAPAGENRDSDRD